jgi:hypothetical protein
MRIRRQQLSISSAYLREGFDSPQIARHNSERLLASVFDFSKPDDWFIFCGGCCYVKASVAFDSENVTLL